MARQKIIITEARAFDEVMMFDFDFIGVPPFIEVFISGVLLHRHDDRRRR